MKPSAFDALENNLRETLSNAQSNPEAMDRASLGLGLTNGYFSSLGGGETLHEEIREYYLKLLREVNNRWWLEKSGYNVSARMIIVNMLIARDGKIISIRLLQGSGNKNSDQALLKSLEKASPLPALPTGYQGDVFVAPLRFNAPLNLLSPSKTG